MEVSWRDDGGDADYRVSLHRREHTGAYRGEGCEHIRIEGRDGNHVHFIHPIGRPPIIDELVPSVWVKADRAGLRLAVRVSLPRTNDPRTGRPVETLLTGDSYTDIGRWQRLTIDRLPDRLTRQVRVLRSELGPRVDGRQAIAEGLVLNVYGGPGVTNVWIDELNVAGHVGVGFRASSDRPPDLPGPRFSAASHAQSRSSNASSGVDAGLGNPGGPELLAAAPGEQSHSISLDNGVLNVDRRPVFPRVVLYRGEPLELIKQLGFNGLWLDEPPSAELLAEARRLALWLVCPPPRSLTGSPAEPAVAARFEIGPEYDCVLAWNIGRDLTQGDLKHTAAIVGRLRSADRRHRRPVIGGATTDLRGFSRHADLLLLDRRPLGTSLDIRDYGRWIRTQPRLARPGTPIWTTVQTQPSAALYHQLATLQPGRKPPTNVSPEQMRLLAMTAIAAGSRGLLMVTESPLDADDPATRERATALELLNLQLSLIEPWAAAGSFLAEIESSHAPLTGSVLRTKRARLALPTWLAEDGQYAAAASSRRPMSVIIPGAPESAIAYQLGPDLLTPLRHERVTGGVQVTLREFGAADSIVLAQDAALIAELTRRAKRIGPRAARLWRDLVARRIEVVEQVERELPPSPKAALPTDRWLADARRDLGWCEQLLESNQYARAIGHARRADQSLIALEHARWTHVVGTAGKPITQPTTTHYRTLPWHAALAQRMAASAIDGNRVAGGGFEDLTRLINSGWQHFEHPSPGVRSAADLVVEASHSGRTGLRLTALPDDPENPPEVLETAPLWITTPPISVDAGELLVIRAWVNIPRPITGSVDGLMLFDSMTGDPLAARLGETDGWQPIVLHRIAPQSGPMRITIALTGLGEARIDDLSVQSLRYHGGTNPVARRR